MTTMTTLEFVLAHIAARSPEYVEIRECQKALQSNSLYMLEDGEGVRFIDSFDPPNDAVMIRVEDGTPTALAGADVESSRAMAVRLAVAHRLAAAHSHLWGSDEVGVLIDAWRRVGLPADWQDVIQSISEKLDARGGAFGGIYAPHEHMNVIQHSTGTGRLTWRVSLVEDFWEIRVSRRAGRVIRDLFYTPEYTGLALDVLDRLDCPSFDVDHVIHQDGRLWREIDPRLLSMGISHLRHLFVRDEHVEAFGFAIRTALDVPTDHPEGFELFRPLTGDTPAFDGAVERMRANASVAWAMWNIDTHVRCDVDAVTVSAGVVYATLRLGSQKERLGPMPAARVMPVIEWIRERDRATRGDAPSFDEAVAAFRALEEAAA